MRAKPPELLTCVGSPVKNRRLASRRSRRLICNCFRPLTCKDNDAKEAQERLMKQWKKRYLEVYQPLINLQEQVAVSQRLFPTSAGVTCNFEPLKQEIKANVCDFEMDD